MHEISRAWYGDYFPANLGLGAKTISLPTSGLVRRLFLRGPQAWCGGYFSAGLGLSAQSISPRASSLISVFLFVLLLSAFSYCFSLVDSHLVTEMISFSIYMSIFFSLCTIDSSNQSLSLSPLFDCFIRL